MLLFACVGGVLSPGHLGAQAAPGYDAALKQYREARYSEAMETIRKSVSGGNVPYEMRMLAAATYMRLGKPSNALAHLHACIKEHPKRFEPRLFLASVLRAGGRTTEALAAARRALADSRDSVTARLEMVRIHYAAGQLERAREQVGVILKAQPKNAEAVMMDGLIFLRQGKLDNAEFRLQQALHLKPNTRELLAQTYTNLGMCYELRARRLPPDQAKAAKQYAEDAARYYRYALETMPKFEPAAKNLARVRPGS